VESGANLTFCGCEDARHHEPRAAPTPAEGDCEDLVAGSPLLLQGAAGTTEAVEDVFRQALDGARRQETLSWELRAATSLARLLRDQGRSADAVACLQPIYDRFTEGFDTADLQAGKKPLDE
jgi:predicted ATPase